jgi:long-subunit acyl-CoA synthetase (AMP-forming)
LKCANLGSLRNIVSFDPVEPDILNQFKAKGINIYLYQQLIAKYLRANIKTETVIHQPNDVVAFCYTSGTTGPPKAAMLSQKNFAAFTGVLKSYEAL